jgi:hypothetical protein
MVIERSRNLRLNIFRQNDFAALLNLVFIALIFVVKQNAADQARKEIDRWKNRYVEGSDNFSNNNRLWAIIDSTWKSPDKSRATIKRLADSQKLPRCKGKPCTGDDARLNTVITSNEKERSIKVGWSKYYFKVLYDNKDKFLTIDASDLLGKTSEQSGEAEEEAE